MLNVVDINCDLGEGMPHDAAIMPLVSSANIACGGHAGDAGTMAAAVALALDHGVAIGAHPGYEDREHFGRRERSLGPRNTVEVVLRQVDALARIAGSHLRHLKLHGALYHQAGGDPDIAEAIAEAVAARWPELFVFAPAGSELVARARRRDLRVVEEAFVDRRYGADGRLLPRTHRQAVVAVPDDAAAQAITLAAAGRVRTVDGVEIPLHADTLCIHGDGPDPVGCVTAVRRALERAGIGVRAPA